MSNQRIGIITLPPSTSSPIIIQPAVCIMHLLLSSANSAMLLPKETRETAFEAYAELGRRLVVCRESWVSRASIEFLDVLY